METVYLKNKKLNKKAKEKNQSKRIKRDNMNDKLKLRCCSIETKDKIEKRV